MNDGDEYRGICEDLLVKAGDAYRCPHGYVVQEKDRVSSLAYAMLENWRKESGEKISHQKLSAELKRTFDDIMAECEPCVINRRPD